MKKITIQFFILSGLLILPAQAECGCSKSLNCSPNKKKISLAKSSIDTIGVKTEIVVEKIIDETIRTTGQIEEIPNKHFDINSPVQGIVVSVLTEIGSHVKAGQAVAVIQSTEISMLETELNQAKAELELAKNNYEREKLLFEQGISAKKEYLLNEALLKSSTAKLDALESNLRILTDYSVNDEQGTFTLITKKTGVLTERNISVGQVITPSQVLFRGSDVAIVWASADVYEKDSNKVSIGQKVNLVLDGTSELTFKGNITYIGSLINKDSRTLPVKASIRNQLNNSTGEVYLKPGSFTQMEIHTGKKKKSIIIPRSAFAEIDKEGVKGKHNHTIFIKKGKHFIPRTIEVEYHDSNNVEVLSGLTTGESIVTQGAYQLNFANKSENHEHIKNEFRIPSPIMVLFIFCALIIGFIIGKKKKG